MLERYLEQLFSDAPLASEPDPHAKRPATAPRRSARINALRLKGIVMAGLAACALWLASGAPPPSHPVSANAAAQGATRPSTSSGWDGERVAFARTSERPTPRQSEQPIADQSATPTLRSTQTSSPTPSSSPSARVTATATATATTPAIDAATKAATQTPPLASSTVSSTILTEKSPTPVPALFPGATPTRLVIPAIHLEAPIIPVGLTHYQVNGQAATTWAVPDHLAVGWHDTSALPGQGGNTVFNGHQDIYGGVFENLDQLNNGDEILVYADAVAYRYRVTEKHLVADEGQPSAVRARNVRWILATPDERLTLVTCAPAPHSDHRLIVVARPQRRSSADYKPTWFVVRALARPHGAQAPTTNRPGS